MNLNGGSKNTLLKKLDSSKNFQIIGNTPDMTADVKKIVDYLENIIINKQTLQTINTTELVQQINLMLQTVEVLHIYKKPVLNMFKLYENISEQARNEYMPQKRHKELLLKKKILEEIMSELQLDNTKIERKDYWVDYE